MTNREKIMVVTFGVFMTEAVIHYNQGLNHDREIKKFELPNGKALLGLMLTVGLFSVITSEITHSMIKT